jgi:hypothetical protein
MTKFDADLYEEIGFKASNGGFFNHWRQLSVSIKEVEEIPLCEAGFRAYEQLKVQDNA